MSSGYALRVCVTMSWYVSRYLTGISHYISRVCLIMSYGYVSLCLTGIRHYGYVSLCLTGTSHHVIRRGLQAILRHRSTKDVGDKQGLGLMVYNLRVAFKSLRRCYAPQTPNPNYQTPDPNQQALIPYYTKP